MLSWLDPERVGVGGRPETLGQACDYYQNGRIIVTGYWEVQTESPVGVKKLLWGKKNPKNKKHCVLAVSPSLCMQVRFRWKGGGTQMCYCIFFLEPRVRARQLGTPTRLEKANELCPCCTAQHYGMQDEKSDSWDYLLASPHKIMWPSAQFLDLCVSQLFP